MRSAASRGDGEGRILDFLRKRRSAFETATRESRRGRAPSAIGSNSKSRLSTSIRGIECPPRCAHRARALAEKCGKSFECCSGGRCGGSLTYRVVGMSRRLTVGNFVIFIRYNAFCV